MITVITEQFVDDGRWCTSCGSYEVMTVEMVDGWNDDCSTDCVIDNSSSSGYIDRQCVDGGNDDLSSYDNIDDFGSGGYVDIMLMVHSNDH